MVPAEAMYDDTWKWLMEEKTITYSWASLSMYSGPTALKMHILNLQSLPDLDPPEVTGEFIL